MFPLKNLARKGLINSLLIKNAGETKYVCGAVWSIVFLWQFDGKKPEYLMEGYVSFLLKQFRSQTQLRVLV